MSNVSSRVVPSRTKTEDNLRPDFKLTVVVVRAERTKTRGFARRYLLQERFLTYHHGNQRWRQACR